MASLGFLPLACKNSLTPEFSELLQVQCLYYNVLNGIILYACGHIKSLFGVTERPFRDTEWPFRVAECPFRVTEQRF